MAWKGIRTDCPAGVPEAPVLCEQVSCKLKACHLSSNAAWTPILDQPKQGTVHSNAATIGHTGAAGWRQKAEMVLHVPHLPVYLRTPHGFMKST